MSVNALNPARLTELVHQRELLREHLSWLDREIARESGIAPESVPASASPISVVVAPVVPSLAPPPDTGLTVVEGYSPPDPKRTAADTKKGCLFAAILVLTLFVAGLVGIYFWKYRDRPLFFATPVSNEKPLHR